MQNVFKPARETTELRIMQNRFKSTSKTTKNRIMQNVFKSTIKKFMSCFTYITCVQSFVNIVNVLRLGHIQLQLVDALQQICYLFHIRES